MLSLLKELTAHVGPCGYEHDVARAIYARLKDVADEIHIDGIGNIVARKRGQNAGPRLVVAAHMDEVGFIVKKILNNGLLRFEKLGGHDDRILLAQRVRVRTESGILPGVIGTISAHMVKFDDPNKVRKHSSLYIDIGASSAEEAQNMGVRIGDPVVWATEVEELGAYRLIGKSFDDRAGCAALVSAFEQIDASRLHGEFIAAFTVQEEVGLRGAHAVAHRVAADVALAIDTTAVSDTPEEMMDDTLELGAGVGIKVMDFSLIASVAVRKRLEGLAVEYGIAHQLELFPGIGTDAGELHKAGGIPTGVLSIPSRYAHSPVEMMDKRDLEATRDLLVKFAEEIRDVCEFQFI